MPTREKARCEQHDALCSPDAMQTTGPDLRSETANAGLVFLGYQAKRRWSAVATFSPAGDKRVEVHTVSECVVPPVQPSRERWDFNRATCYERPELAEALVPEDWKNEWGMLAFWLDPATDIGGEFVRVDLTELFPDSLPALPAEGGPSAWEVLGWDVVALEASNLGFGCAPLSCNYMAKEEAVNQFCLMDNHAEARRVVSRFNAEQPEPGRYFAVRIARRFPAGHPTC